MFVPIKRTFFEPLINQMIMKKVNKKLSLLVTLVLMLTMSCSKTEVEKTNPAAIIGGEIYRSQIVTVNLPDITLMDDEYQATLGGVAITLTKVDVHKFLLPVSFSVPLGTKDLVIPSLNNTIIRYDVKESVLAASAEVTMEPFMTKLATYSKSLNSSPNNITIQKSINSFNAVYANLTPAEKTEMAIIYKTNKDLIDPILVGDFSKFNKKTKAPNDPIITLFVLHKAAVLGIAAGAVLFQLGTLPAVKALGAVIAGVSTGFAIEHFGNIITNSCVILGTYVDGILGENNRVSNNAASSLSFQSDVEKTVNFNTNNRTLNSSDGNKSQSDLASFFEYSTKYNKIISSINTQITWVNNNVIFANFSLLPLEVMPTTSSTTNIVANQTVFSKIKFTISHPNLSLISSSMLSDGKLNLKIKIVGTPASLPMESFLNYSYSDEFSAFSGKLPIKVTFDCTNTTLSASTQVNGNNATANVTGGTPPYTYLWTNGATTQIVNNLAVGSYYLEVKDAFGCTKKTKDFVIGCKDLPSINSTQWVCDSKGQVTARVAFSAGTTGILIGGGSGWCDPALTCYPVRLYFLSPGATDWSISYNGYNVSLVSGDKYNGVLELSFVSSWASCDGLNPLTKLNNSYPNYKWKVELMNQCNERTSSGL